MGIENIECRPWKKIFDLYEWLPGYGETAVELRSSGSELIISMLYDCNEEIYQREIRFSRVFSFHYESFPGPSLLNIREFDAKLLLQGALIEYPDSKIALKWTKHFDKIPAAKHYRILFLAANKSLIVFAGSVTLGDCIKL